jgi:predicted RNA-binding Zn-ribbon protein involved in translation (DUF1610 family)
MSGQWRIRVGDKVTKPLSPQQVQQLLRKNRIPADALISSDGTTWRAIADLKREGKAKPPPAAADAQQPDSTEDNEPTVLASVDCPCSWNRTLRTRKANLGKKAKCPMCGTLVTIKMVDKRTNASEIQTPIRDELSTIVRSIPANSLPEGPPFSRETVRFQCKRCDANVAVTRDVAGREKKCPECGWKNEPVCDRNITHLSEPQQRNLIAFCSGISAWTGANGFAFGFGIFMFGAIVDDSFARRLGNDFFVVVCGLAMLYVVGAVWGVLVCCIAMSCRLSIGKDAVPGYTPSRYVSVIRPNSLTSLLTLGFKCVVFVEDP